MIRNFQITSIKKISFKHGFQNFPGGPVDFPGGSVVKNLPANAGDADEVLIPGSRRSPGGGNGNPLQYSCLGKSHGQGSLAGYSPSGFKESKRTEPQLGTGGPVVKNAPCNAKFVDLIPVRSTCVSQWKIPNDANKIPRAAIRSRCNQINKYLNKTPVGFLPARNRLVSVPTLMAGEDGGSKERKKSEYSRKQHMLWCFKIKQKYWLCVLIKEEQPHAISQIRRSYGYCTLGSRSGGKCHFK